MSNRDQRVNNRETARWLRHQQRCTRCNERGLHYVHIPQSLQGILDGVPSEGFWTCPDLYGPDGRRIAHD